MRRTKPATISIVPEWQQHFRQHTLQTKFLLCLTQPMIEMLCATADGVMWDRSLFLGIHCPDNFVATENALIKRGLVESVRENKAEMAKRDFRDACVRLTPAGKALIQLFKVTGIFVECDNAIRKRARG